jgi:DNA-binding MarR family transcriptional regulator
MIASMSVVVDAAEQLVVAGVALTARALAGAGGMDLTFPQWRVIVVLGQNPGGLTVSEVAARIGVTLPATSRQLRRLERKRLVHTQPDEADRRATRASLTVEGEQVRRRITDFRRSELTRGVGSLDVSAPVVATLNDIALAMVEFV